MDIHREERARALLNHLSATRGEDDPLGSLARAVLSGEASLREAVTYSWHQMGLLDALEHGIPQMDDARRGHDLDQAQPHVRGHADREGPGSPAHPVLSSITHSAEQR